MFDRPAEAFPPTHSNLLLPGPIETAPVPAGAQLWVGSPFLPTQCLTQFFNSLRLFPGFIIVCQQIRYQDPFCDKVTERQGDKVTRQLSDKVNIYINPLQANIVAYRLYVLHLLPMFDR